MQEQRSGRSFNLPNIFSKNFRKYCIFNKKYSKKHTTLLSISNKKNITGNIKSLALPV